jgi:GntR family transcriptional regulator
VVVVRRRHLHDKTTGQLEEIGASYIPVDIAGGTFLEEATVVPKALFLCVEDLSGQQYTHARDAWVSRLPTAGEADLFNLAPDAPVLHVTHTARAAEGNVLEISESIWPADRVMFIDEYEIPEHGQAPEARSDI